MNIFFSFDSVCVNMRALQIQYVLTWNLRRDHWHDFPLFEINVSLNTLIYENKKKIKENSVFLEENLTHSFQKISRSQGKKITFKSTYLFAGKYILTVCCSMSFSIFFLNEFFRKLFSFSRNICSRKNFVSLALFRNFYVWEHIFSILFFSNFEISKFSFRTTSII